MKGNSYERVRTMVICAMLTALSVLLTRFVSPQLTDAMRFSFGTVPIMLAGILFGPVYGFIVGVAADLLGCLINLMGSSFVITLTLCSGLMGVVPAVLYRYVFKFKKNIINLSLALILGEFIVSALLKSLCLWQLYGGTFLTWFTQKLITASVMSVVEIITVPALVKVSERLIKRKSSSD